jgi:hypothetical protein
MPKRRQGVRARAATEESFLFKIEVENGKGIWTDVRADDGSLLTFESEEPPAPHWPSAIRFLVQMERYAGGNVTRVIRILEDDDDWPKRAGGS